MIRLFILLAFIFIMMFVICGKNDYDKCYSDMEYRGCFKDYIGDPDFDEYGTFIRMEDAKND